MATANIEEIIIVSYAIGPKVKIAIAMEIKEIIINKIKFTCSNNKDIGRTIRIRIYLPISLFTLLYSIIKHNSKKNNFKN